MSLLQRVQDNFHALLSATLQHYCEREESDRADQLWCQAVDRQSVIAPFALHGNPGIVQTQFLAGSKERDDEESFTLQCREQGNLLHCDLHVNAKPFRSIPPFGCGDTYVDKYRDVGDAVASTDLSDISPNEDAADTAAKDVADAGDVVQDAADATPDTETVADAGETVAEGWIVPKGMCCETALEFNTLDKLAPNDWVTPNLFAEKVLIQYDDSTNTGKEVSMTADLIADPGNSPILLSFAPLVYQGLAAPIQPPIVNVPILLVYDQDLADTTGEQIWNTVKPAELGGNTLLIQYDAFTETMTVYYQLSTKTYGYYQCGDNITLENPMVECPNEEVQP
ncbi:MAG: hypothetical protein HY543_07180 [Deltaproteobacteria bacterium]|nr:hypothetical protein [Deltaproteobacteria bacterium]